jgi:hypothetical protein
MKTNDIKDEKPIKAEVQGFRVVGTQTWTGFDEIFEQFRFGAGVFDIAEAHGEPERAIENLIRDKIKALTSDLASAHEQIRQLTEGIERANTRADKFHDGLYQIADWAKAYPVKIFPELSSEDWANIADVLKVAGYSLDCVSASNMRHVITKVGEIAASALQEKQP